MKSIQEKIQKLDDTEISFKSKKDLLGFVAEVKEEALADVREMIKKRIKQLRVESLPENDKIKIMELKELLAKLPKEVKA